MEPAASGSGATHQGGGHLVSWAGESAEPNPSYEEDGAAPSALAHDHHLAPRSPPKVLVRKISLLSNEVGNRHVQDYAHKTWRRCRDPFQPVRVCVSLPCLGLD